MSDAALFMSALRAAVPVQPDPRLGEQLVPRLAEAARAATIEAETAASRRPRSRMAWVLRVGIAVAAIPLLFAGLAVAGVSVPEPARTAFDKVGITLPNQPPDHASPTSRGSEGVTTKESTQEKTTVSGEGNSSDAHKNALEQHKKATGNAVAHDRGKAIGLHESTPPGKSGDTGPPDHSNAGGSASSHSADVRARLPGP
ncbi:MAG: hypothetical protein ACJ75Z_05665, partial [Solirubrobacterales bacterium]